MPFLWMAGCLLLAEPPELTSSSPSGTAAASDTGAVNDGFYSCADFCGDPTTTGCWEELLSHYTDQGYDCESACARYFNDPLMQCIEGCDGGCACMEDQCGAY